MCLVQLKGVIRQFVVNRVSRNINRYILFLQDLRKRYRYLSHLPLSCEFTFCELMIKQPVLSKETLRLFAEEFRQRKIFRQRKKREERSVARKIERRLAVNSFGIGNCRLQLLFYDCSQKIFLASRYPHLVEGTCDGYFKSRYRVDYLRNLCFVRTRQLGCCLVIAWFYKNWRGEEEK